MRATRILPFAALFASWSAATGAAVPLAPSSSTASAEVEIVHVANAGFLLKGPRKILIDALFGTGLAGYPALAPEQRQALESGEPPFDGVDLVLATHHHGDHFDAAAVARFLERHSAAQLLSTPQAIDHLREVVAADSPVLHRARAIEPREDRPEALEIAGVRLTVFALHHGRNRQPPVLNLGVLIDLGGLAVLHVGDTEASAEEMRTAGLRDPVDIALAAPWNLAEVQEVAKPRRSVVMHLPASDAPAGYFYPSESIEGLLRHLRDRFPGVILPTQTLERIAIGEP